MEAMPRSGSQPMPAEQIRNFQHSWSQNRGSDALRYAEQASITGGTAETRQLWTAITEKLRKIEGLNGAYRAAVADALLTKAAQACLTAKTAGDLDAVRDEIDMFVNDRTDRYDPVSQQAQRRLSEARGFIQQWQQMLAAVAIGDHVRAESALNNLSSERGVTLLGADAMAAKRAEMAKLIADAQARLTQELERRLADADTYEKAREVQRWLDAEAAQSRNPYSGSGINTLTQARQLMQMWVSVLHAESSGSPQQALNTLTQMRGSYREGFTLLPPAMVEAKAQALQRRLTDGAKVPDAIDQAVRTALDEAESSDDLVRLLAQTNALMQGDNDLRNTLSQFQQDLQELLQLTRVTESGNLDQSWSAIAASASQPRLHPWNTLVRRTRDRLLRLAVMRAAQTDGHVRLADDKPIDEALREAAASAAQQRQWDVAHRLLDQYQRVFVSGRSATPVWLAAELSALTHLRVAGTYEKAGDATAAAAAYRRVIEAAPSQGLADYAARRLAEYGKQDPQAFEQSRQIGPVPTTPVPPMMIR